MHRIVWERENGPIPPGLHVHHVDEDKANNALANLRLLTVAEHLAMHPGRWEHPGWTGEQSSERARARANNLWATREPRRLVCVECGAEFFSTGMRSKFCHQNCRARRRRRILKEAALS